MAKLDKFQEMLLKDLKGLGNSSKAIAATLTKCKVKGTPDDPSACAIAEHLLKTYRVKNIGIGSEVSVNGVILSNEHIPKAINDFINDFDAGNYPHLIKKGAK